MSDEDNDLVVYTFEGKDGEETPRNVGKLIVHQDVQVLPAEKFSKLPRLQKVCLQNGLIEIDIQAFFWCTNLLEISICNTVKRIGARTFLGCKKLTKVEFESETASPHQLQTIGEEAFRQCFRMSRINLPMSVTSIGRSSFYYCSGLKEANLSTTGLTEIDNWAFYFCWSLQTVSLPNSLRRIGLFAFAKCYALVTVLISRDSSSINIEQRSFAECKRLANLVLPQDSTAEGDSFEGSEILHERYGEDVSSILAGLMQRFENFSVHRMCYDQSATTIEELRECLANQQEGVSFVDEFGMTPFHILFLTAEPSIELLEVLLESLPNQLFGWKDAIGKRPLHYLFSNWTSGNKSLVQRTLQQWAIDRLARWGSTSWTEAMQTKVLELLAAEDNRRRVDLCEEVYSLMEHYESVKSVAILEMTLWKWKLKSGRSSSDGAKRQALDRQECRYLSGADVVIPPIAAFLGITSRNTSF